MNGGSSGVRLPLDRDLAVAHRLEQGALGPGRGPVDLVGQDHVGEDRARLEDELAAGRVVDARAEDVRGEQVGRELEPAERAVDARGQGPGQQRLAHARDVLDQDVPLGQQRHDGQLDDLGLAQDDRPDVLQEPVAAATCSSSTVGGGRSRRSGANSCDVLRSAPDRHARPALPASRRLSSIDQRRPTDSNARDRPRPAMSGLGPRLGRAMRSSAAR